jgi:hypothetical protein
MCRRTKIKNFNLLVENSTLDNYKKELLIFRYLKILRDFQNRCRWYSWIFHNCRIIVSIGSLLVPALMSIQYSKENLFSFINSIEVPIYWTTWGISLIVTIANGIYTLFKIDKKYYFLHSVYEKLQSEGYQYFSLTGKYSGKLNKTKRKPSHENQFIYFCHNIEKIKLSQVYEEFFKLSETSTSNPEPPKEQGTKQQPLPLEHMTQTIRGDAFSPRQREDAFSPRPRPFNENIYDDESSSDRRPALDENIIQAYTSINASVIDSDSDSDRTSIHSV